MGATLGGAYLQERNVGGTEGEDEYWDIGIKYKLGANSFSVGYLETSDNTTGNEDKSDFWEIGYTRALGPGVDWKSSIGRQDFDGSGSGGTNDNDGLIVTTGVQLSF